MQIFCILTKRFLKSYAKIKLIWIQIVLYDHRRIQVLYPRVLIPTTEKVIQPRPHRIYRQKTRNSFWSVNYTRSKISFLCSGNKLQIFKYPPFEQTLCIRKNRKCISFEKENYNDIGTHLDFRQEYDIRITTLLQR